MAKSVYLANAINYVLSEFWFEELSGKHKLVIICENIH